MNLLGNINTIVKETVDESSKEVRRRFDDLENAKELSPDELWRRLNVKEIPNGEMTRSLFAAVSICLSRNSALTSSIIAKVVTGMLKETNLTILPVGQSTLSYAAGILDGSIPPSIPLLQIIATSLGINIIHLGDSLQTFIPKNSKQSCITIFLKPGLAGTSLSVVNRDEEIVSWETAEVKKLQADGAEMLSETKELLDSEKRLWQKRKCDIEDVRSLLRSKVETEPTTAIWTNIITGELKIRPSRLVDKEQVIVSEQGYPEYLLGARALIWKSLWDSRLVKITLWNNWPSIKIFALVHIGYSSWMRGLSGWERLPNSAVNNSLREVMSITLQPGQTVVIPAIPSPKFSEIAGFKFPVLLAYHFIRDNVSSSMGP